MRITSKNKILKGRAIAGTHVVILAWDFVSSNENQFNDLMGFSLNRAEFKDGKTVEQYPLRGIKRFRFKDKGLPPGTLVPTSEHPIQSFQWADYTANENRDYEYVITPIYGNPKNLQPDTKASLMLRITTEPQTLSSKEKPRHDIYFNRGVIGSQAYAREFKNKAPDSTDPGSEEMKWLSRGLFEGLINFISLAKNDSYSLRAALYEFHYQPVANAFAAAVEGGADVKIVYDAESSYKDGNNETIRKARLDKYDAVIPRTVSEGIRHNKFIILEYKKKPIAVWTGSTNISDGGIFGHSNVGHIVWDDKIATMYKEYWDRLSQNLTPTKLRQPNREASPLPKNLKEGVVAVFSPRDGKEENDGLEWYAKIMGSAKEIVCFTVAFKIDEVFEEVLCKENDVLRYVVKDDDLESGVIINTDKDVVFAAGGYLGYKSLYNFAGEIDNPLNENNYIHTKFMLVDPLSETPVVVTGSANFSRPSQRINDENMLIIKGDTRVADIYFGEYMRIFDHHYSRYIVRKLTKSKDHDPNAGYLKETPNEWVLAHFDVDSYKNKRRLYFVG